MSRIYLARHVDSEQDVAVKVLRDDLVIHPRIREHFQREYYVLSRFQHPNALAFYGADLNDPQGPFLVMEYVPGLDLSELLQRRGAFHPERVGRLLWPLCQVLQAAHDAGIVHRDLKPSNLKVRFPFTSHETVKLMDFGLAKITGMLYIAPEDVGALGGKTAVGTPEYICPEQARDADMDHRGDLYSVGVILFELLTGKRPFEGDSMQALLKAHASTPPPTFADVGAHRVPPGVEAVVRSCLAKHPGERPQSALELARRYEKALGLKPAVSSPAAPVPTPARPAVQPAAPPPTEPSRAARPAASPPVRISEPGAHMYHLQARMPESMAMLKLRGFIHDQGGTVLESAPGVIRVRLSINRPSVSATSWGISSWQAYSESTSRTAESGLVEMELYLARKDPAQPDLHAITLVLRMRNRSVLAGVEWRNRCQQIHQDLQTYLSGR
ncbi:MAG: serine/threonine protein kinase [Gemmataceae bacterium]|nr:serine/threonine protein kinase [Gemmataceae bacterium]